MVGVPILVLLLPTQVGALDSVHKVAQLGIILTLGGLAGVITPPLSGALSDRTTSRMGRRRPWILGGVIGVVVGLLVATLFPSIPVLAVAWIVINGAGNLLLAAMTFVLPDRVPERQRGTASALVGLALPVGQVVGLLFVTTILNSANQSVPVAYAALIALVVVLGGGFLLLYREPRLPKKSVQPFHLGTFLKGFWVNPRAYPDFAYAWVTRFLVFLAYFTVSSFTLYYLTDVIHYTQIFPGQTVAEGVTLVTGISTICIVIAMLLGGLISDRLQRRKPFIIVAGIILGLGLLLLALVHTWPVVLISAVLQGIGLGAYVTVDIALITQVLPRAENRGQDLGVMVIALNIAQFIAPTVGAVIVSIFAASVVVGYSALYLVAAILVLLASVLVLPIKGVR
jgi:MFS family permease